MDGGSTFSPECAASQANQSVHQLPSWRWAAARHRSGVSAWPVLVRPIGAFAARRVDDAGNVAAGREDETHLAARELGDAPSRVPGHDVVLLRADRVDVQPDAAEVQCLALQLDLAGLRSGCSRRRCCAGTSRAPPAPCGCRRCSSRADRTPAASDPAGSCSPRSTKSGRCCAAG